MSHRPKASSQSYSTTRRHSLYGIEDRVVIDPGSRIWKVGFSGEGRPRDVFFPQGKNGAPLWTLSRASESTERVEEDTLLELKLEACLRNVFHRCARYSIPSRGRGFFDGRFAVVFVISRLLLTDPRARKVIMVENALLPLHIKEALARILFENLQVLRNVPLTLRSIFI
jgi:actin-related protein 10